ncbi:MAG: hypothetical protein R3C97_10125 [Geminicoccaceae bacterium]
MTAYAEIFGLTGRPFRLEPDPDWFFDCRAQRETLARLTAALAEGTSLNVLTGEAGVGKTILARLIEARLQQPGLPILHFRADDIEAVDQARLNHTSGRKLLIIIDEAQRLPRPKLEQLAGLSGIAGVRILMLGRPELLERLRDSSSNIARKAVRGALTLKPLGSDEVAPYVHHRMRLAGWRGERILTRAGRDALFLASGGYPRRLGRICARALALAAIDGQRTIDATLVEQAVRDTMKPAGRGHDNDLGALQARVDRLQNALDYGGTGSTGRARREAALDIEAAQRLLRWLSRMQEEQGRRL